VARRGRVFGVAAVYVVVAVAMIEAADVVLPRLGLPEWTVTFVVVLVLLGFPLAVVLAWALDPGRRSSQLRGAAHVAAREPRDVLEHDVVVRPVVARSRCGCVELRNIEEARSAHHARDVIDCDALG
jgi:hypothetical protein